MRLTHKINNHKRQGILLLKDRTSKGDMRKNEESEPSEYLEAPSQQRKKSVYKGPEAGVTGSDKEQPRGFLLWLECSEPGKENLRSRSNKGPVGLLRTLLFLLSTRENHGEF